MNWISFPGLGIDPFCLDTTAFSLFGRDVKWYGVLITLGIILSFFFAKRRAEKKENVSEDDFYTLTLFMLPISVICARIYFVVFHGGYSSLSEIVAIWKGGLAIYGGLIGGLATVLVFAKINKIKVFSLLDPIASSVFIGQAIGRWGNFVNAEAHGSVTGLPWRMGIGDGKDSINAFYHPTFLYESLWNVIGFLIAQKLYKNKKFPGQIFFFYIAWYGLGRGLIELLRSDSLYLGNIKVSSLLGFICFVAGTVFYIVLMKKAKAADNMSSEYESAFSITENNEKTTEEVEK